jgi:hypothetical protein
MAINVRRTAAPPSPFVLSFFLFFNKIDDGNGPNQNRQTTEMRDEQGG